MSVLQPPKDVDAYVLVVANSSDVAQARRRIFAHDRRLVSHNFHSKKWASRKGGEDHSCAFDVWKKAFDAMEGAEGGLTSVNWSESDLNVLADYELWSLKPVLFVVNVSREQYLHQVLGSGSRTVLGTVVTPCSVLSAV